MAGDVDGRIPDSGSDDLLEGRIPSPSWRRLTTGLLKARARASALIGSLIGDRPSRKTASPTSCTSTVGRSMSPAMSSSKL